mgnify:CR=1 FL=1
MENQGKRKSQIKDSETFAFIAMAVIAIIGIILLILNLVLWD